MFPKLRGDFYEPSWVFFQNFPIHIIDPSDEAAVQQRDQIINLVGKMLELLRYNPTTPQEKEQLQGSITATAKFVDSLVANHYGLTYEEIKIVESYYELKTRTSIWYG